MLKIIHYSLIIVNYHKNIKNSAVLFKIENLFWLKPEVVQMWRSNSWLVRLLLLREDKRENNTARKSGDKCLTLHILEAGQKPDVPLPGKRPKEKQAGWADPRTLSHPLDASPINLTKTWLLHSCKNNL